MNTYRFHISTISEYFQDIEAPSEDEAIEALKMRGLSYDADCLYSDDVDKIFSVSKVE
jgi:hypothetical protein